MGSSPAGSEKLCENFYQELGDRSSSFVWVFWTFGGRGEESLRPYWFAGIFTEQGKNFTS